MRIHNAISLSVCFILTASASAQPEPAIPYPETLYRMADVGKTLEITEDQILLLDKLTKKIQESHRASYTGINEKFESEKTIRIEEANRSYYSDWVNGAREILNRDQLTRYQQLIYQYRGFNSLNEPEVRKAIGLTEEQLSKLADEIELSNDKLSDVELVGGILPERAYVLYRAYWNGLPERYNKFLSPKQQKIWRELTGEPYVFQRTFVAYR